MSKIEISILIVFFDKSLAHSNRRFVSVKEVASQIYQKTPLKSKFQILTWIKVALLICFVVHSGTCLGTRSWSGRTGRRITTIFLVSIVISTIHYQKNWKKLVHVCSSRRRKMADSYWNTLASSFWQIFLDILHKFVGKKFLKMPK